MSSKFIQKRTTLFDGFFRVSRYWLKYPDFDGESRKTEHILCEKANGVGVLLYHSQRKSFVFVKQFRSVVCVEAPRSDGFLLEIPAGSCEQGSSVEENAIRETEEETGYSPKNLDFLCDFYPSPGILTERVSVFFATIDETCKVGIGGGLASEKEFIQVVEIPVPQAYQKLDRGDFHDAKTMIALYRMRQEFSQVPTAS